MTYTDFNVGLDHDHPKNRQRRFSVDFARLYAPEMFSKSGKTFFSKAFQTYMIQSRLSKELCHVSLSEENNYEYKYYRLMDLYHNPNQYHGINNKEINPVQLVEEKRNLYMGEFWDVVINEIALEKHIGILNFDSQNVATKQNAKIISVRIMETLIAQRRIRNDGQLVFSINVVGKLRNIKSRTYDHDIFANEINSFLKTNKEVFVYCPYCLVYVKSQAMDRDKMFCYAISVKI